MKLTHTDEHGNARMVDVGQKPMTERSAVAEGWILMGPDACLAVRERSAKKGDVLAVAQLAGIQAAKRTSDLIPLCHPLPITSVRVDLALDEERAGVRAVATVAAHWRTGVEMEAMTAASAAALTIYDMLKGTERGIVIEALRLLEKKGGRSGHWTRPGS